MSRFAIRTPYFIVVACLIVAMLGVVSVSRMPVDMFPAINIPVVVVATFYSGMPPEQIESNITYPLGALPHARQRNRAHRVALTDRASASSRFTSSPERTPIRP